MRRFLFFVYFFLLSLSIFSQERTITSELIYSESANVYALRSQVNNFVKPKYWVLVPFVDWSFVDSLKYRLLDFFEERVQKDTFMNNEGYSIRFHIYMDTLGEVVFSEIIVPSGLIPYFSFDKMKEVQNLFMDFHFHVPKYQGKIANVSDWRHDNVDAFDVFGINGDYKYKSKIVTTSVDYEIRRRHRAKLPGKWNDSNGNVYEIYIDVDSIPQSIGMLHPLTHQWGRFRYGFGQDQLHIYFGEESTPVDYRWKENHLVLKGKLEGQEFEYTLTRVLPEKDEK